MKSVKCSGHNNRRKIISACVVFAYNFWRSFVSLRMTYCRGDHWSSATIYFVISLNAATIASACSETT